MRSHQDEFRQLVESLDAQAAQVWSLFARLERKMSRDDRRKADVQACRDALLDGFALTRRLVERIAAEYEPERMSPERPQRLT